MLTYKKYIAASILVPLITLAFILTSFSWITQILRLLYLIDKGIKLSDFFQLVVLIVPSLLFMIMPLVTLLSVIYIYNRLQEERQIVILRSSGLNNLSIAKPALLVATILTVISGYISAYLMPFSYNKLKEELLIFHENHFSKIIDTRTFNQVSKHITIYVDRKKTDGTMEGVILFDNRVPEDKTIIFAKYGRIMLKDKSPMFELNNGMRQSYNNDGNMTKLSFDNMLVEIKNDSNSIVRDKTSLELYIHEMLWPDVNLSPERQNRLIVDGHQRIIWPLYNYVFTFLALSLFLTYPYNRKTHIRQLLITFVPIIVIAYIHFTLQKMAYKHIYFVFCSYAVILSIIGFSIWQSRKRIL